MPINNLPLFTFEEGLTFIFKVGFIIFAILYFIFSLIVIRQIKTMTTTIMTEGGSILRAFAILFAGLSLGVVVLFIGLL